MKMENLNKLKDEQERLHQKINSLAEEKGLTLNGAFPITDGIYSASAEEYLASTPKVMWILKEPWEEGEKEGNWDLLACMNEDGAACKNRTWQVMAYTMCGIREDKEWATLPSISKDMMKLLGSIACINISKMPANKNSNDAEIREAYNLWKELLFEQIRTYAPDVIIFGGTFKYFAPDLGRYAKMEEAIDNGECYGVLYRDEKGTFLIDTKHPSYVPGRANRVDSMIALVKICKEKMSAQ